MPSRRPASSSSGSGFDPELSSVATALEELTKRVTSIAERHSSGPREGTAAELFEVERAMTGAHRRLARLLEG